MDITNIARGFINKTKADFGVADPMIEKLAEERYKICLECDTISADKIRCDKEKGGCNCFLSWLTRSNKLCVKGYWNGIRVDALDKNRINKEL